MVAPILIGAACAEYLLLILEHSEKVTKLYQAKAMAVYLMILRGS